MRRVYLVLILVLSILILDQTIKIWIKTHLIQGDEFELFSSWSDETAKLRETPGRMGASSDSWARIHFTENNGMAFGLEFAGVSGKLFLTIFRIIAVGAIGWYIARQIRRKASKGLIVCLSLIWAGAFGNIIDSMFYGMIFNDSVVQVAQFMPEGGGYAPFLQGRVVDMFYFPLFEGHFPEWFPFWGGESFLFFRPVFNVADAAISVGVVSLLVFQRRFFLHPSR
jgi:signal peptidase II